MPDGKTRDRDEGARPGGTARDGDEARLDQAVRDQGVARFVERFAAALIEAGVPRMPARSFSALLSSDSGRMTAAELGSALRASPAAVSGAMRYLIQVNLATREREPGSRRDVFSVHGDAWYEAIMRRDQLLVRWEDTLREGIDVLGADTSAGARMSESLAFLEFVGKEVPELMERWRAYKARLATNTGAADTGG